MLRNVLLSYLANGQRYFLNEVLSLNAQESVGIGQAHAMRRSSMKS